MACEEFSGTSPRDKYRGHILNGATEKGLVEFADSSRLCGADICFIPVGCEIS
jgi:hypothetical protein